MKKLKERWGIKSNFQIAIIILVFAITGSSATYFSKPILYFLNINKENTPLWLYYPTYVALIFPLYQIMLVTYGFLFGQIKFFWAFEKKMLNRIKLGFLANWIDSKRLK